MCGPPGVFSQVKEPQDDVTSASGAGMQSLRSGEKGVSRPVVGLARVP